MKKSVVLFVILVIASCVIVFTIMPIVPVEPALKKAAHSVPKTFEKQEGPSFPSKAERSRMSNEARFRILENLGYLPDDSTSADCDLAEKTSWWGKKLDPGKFWADKVVWYDDISEWEARRRGRGYPPIPYDAPSLADRSDTDHQPEGHGAEGPTIRYVGSERESVFWNTFSVSHPRPPEKINAWQRNNADSWLRSKQIVEHDPIYATKLRMKLGDLEEKIAADRREASTFGYPYECVTSDAYFWAHVMEKRKEYENILSKGQKNDDFTLSHFFGRVYVDRKYITEPLSEADLQAANAWKLAYLRRLRREKTDESYINAYLKAWNLSSNDVFGISGSP